MPPELLGTYGYPWKFPIISIIDENKGFERKNIEVKTAKNRNTSRKNVELQKYWITKMSNYKNIEKESA